MPIIFSAITPHSPLLNQQIGKNNFTRLKDTYASFKKLEEELYSSKPDIIIIISPHGPVQANSFTINISPEFKINFEEFGDFSTKLKITGDIGLAYKIRERMETRAPLQLISNSNLDHGASIPLLLLTSHLANIKIIPVYHSGLDLEAHFKFGQLLKRELQLTKNRVAIIASGDLSHKITKDAPAGYSPKAKKFDQKLIELISGNKTNEILKLNKDTIADACECGLKSIVMLLGILDGIKHHPQILSYEAPFGVGYLTMNIRL